MTCVVLLMFLFPLLLVFVGLDLIKDTGKVPLSFWVAFVLVFSALVSITSRGGLLWKVAWTMETCSRRNFVWRE